MKPGRPGIGPHHVLGIKLQSPPFDRIARSGYDPVFGARPLKRFRQRHVETVLSRKLLAGDIADHSRVTVDFRRSELVFEAKTAKT